MTQSLVEKNPSLKLILNEICQNVTTFDQAKQLMFDFNMELIKTLEEDNDNSTNNDDRQYFTYNIMKMIFHYTAKEILKFELESPHDSNINYVDLINDKINSHEFHEHIGKKVSEKISGFDANH